MIKYISSKGYLFKFNKDTENIASVNEIDWYMGRVGYFIIEEDGEINGEEVHSGDVVITILDGDAVFKVPDDIATIIKSKVKDLDKKKAERELLQRSVDPVECN